MAPDGTSRLDQADPRVGDTLLFEGLEWAVTDHSSYWNPEGYRVNEWCCETDTVTAYVLKEVGERGPTRWLFTREIPVAGVTRPDGQPLGERLPPEGASRPPETLGYQGQTYRYADTTEGTYEDEPGERDRKTTWDYWDAGRARNLAVEVWADGRVACYLGAYVEPGQVTLRPAAGSSRAEPKGPTEARPTGPAPGVARLALGWRAGASPFPLAVVAVPVAYLLPFFAGQPFDRSIAFALLVAAFVGWARALARAPLAALGAALLVPALAAVFLRFPPLTSGPGLGALLAAPVGITWLARLRGLGGERPLVRYLAAFGVTVPLLGVGLYHYFWFAPGPHTLGQWVLAVGPAALGGLAALAVAALGLLGAEEGAR